MKWKFTSKVVSQQQQTQSVGQDHSLQFNSFSVELERRLFSVKSGKKKNSAFEQAETLMLVGCYLVSSAAGSQNLATTASCLNYSGMARLEAPNQNI